jgi:type IV secretion system protein VirB11
VRDGAALEVLKAWNTGHPGGLLSLHANSANDALARLEDLVTV